MQPVAGLFDHFENANQAVLSLEEAGLDKDRISILARKKTVPQDLELKRPAKGVAASAGTGAAAGGVIGGLLAILAGLGAVLIPGLGPVLAVGALSTGLGVVAGGAGVGAAVGGILGAMLGLSIPEEDAHVYAEGVRRGGILVVAQPSTEEEALQVSQIMHQHGALNINELRQDWQQSGWTHYRDPDESEEAPPLRSDLG